MTDLSTSLQLLSWGAHGWADELASGLWVTLKLAVSAYLFGTLIGLGLALLGRQGPAGARAVLAFNALIRGVPEILILFLLYYGGGKLIEPALAALLPAEWVTAVASFLAGQLALGFRSEAEVQRIEGGLVFRHVETEEAGGAADGPALDQQRDQHHHEGDVEIALGIGQAGQDRDRGEEDRDRAAQAHPGDEAALRPGEAEGPMVARPHLHAISDPS